MFFGIFDAKKGKKFHPNQIKIMKNQYSFFYLLAFIACLLFSFSRHDFVSVFVMTCMNIAGALFVREYMAERAVNGSNEAHRKQSIRNYIREHKLVMKSQTLLLCILILTLITCALRIAISGTESETALVPILTGLIIFGVTMISIKTKIRYRAYAIAKLHRSFGTFWEMLYCPKKPKHSAPNNASKVTRIF